MPLTLDILEGSRALELLREAAGSGAWSRLAEADPKSTCFQEPAFVLPWYGAYADSWEPLAIVGRDGDGGLVGLMALARSPAGDGLVHAGAHQAEYHGWIADPEVEGGFPARAVAAAMERVPARRWGWTWLPPGAPTGWLRDPSRSGPAARLDEVDNPVWDVTDEEFFEGRVNKSRLRNYRNRLAREGRLWAERYGGGRGVGSAGDADRGRRIDEILEILADWCDFRQGAINGVLPFRDDPAKLPFHRGMLESGCAVLTVLRLDDDPVAVHVGPFDGDRLYMGVQGYDPARSAVSPGILLLMEVARDVRELGGTTVDLTPGGAWKRRYSNRSETLHRVELHASRLGVVLRDGVVAAGDLARSALRRAGLEPRRVAEGARELSDRLVPGRGGGDPASVSPEAGAPWRLFEVELEGFEARVPAAPSPTGDLLRFDRDRDREATRRWLSAALDLRGAGWRPFAVVDDGRLRAVSWLQPPEGVEELPRIPDSPCGGPSEGAAVVLVDLDEQPVATPSGVDGDGPPPPALRRVLEAAAEEATRAWVLVGSSSTTVAPWLETAGRELGRRGGTSEAVP